MPGAAPLLEVAAQVLLLAGQDHVLRLLAQPAHDRRHHQARQVVGHGAAQERARPAPTSPCSCGHAVALEQVGELVGDALGPAAPEGLVGQRDRQLLAVRIGHHAGELAGLRALLRRLLRARLAQQRLRQLDGGAREVFSGRRVVRPAHRLQCTHALIASGGLPALEFRWTPHWGT